MWNFFVMFGLSVAVQSQTVPVTSFTDGLRPTPQREVGKPLDKTDIEEGGGKWTATKSIVMVKDGVSANGPGASQLSFPVIAGKIHVEADVDARGTSWTGLALGRAKLSELFWRNLAVMVTVTSDGRYNLFAAGRNLVAAPTPGLIHSDSPNHIEFDVDTTTRMATVRINGHPAIENLVLPPEAQLNGISAAGFHFHEPVDANVPVVSNFKVSLASLSATAFTPLDYSMFFVTPGADTTLQWKVGSPGPSHEVPYVINDYSGNQIDSGVANLGEDGILSLKRVFKQGYFEVVFPLAAESFGIVSIDPHAGPVDPFFGVDASMTSLELDPARRVGLVKIMSRTGLSIARERSSAIFGKGPGQYNWEGGERKMESLRRVYSDHNVRVLDIVMRDEAKFGMMKGQIFPQNLAVMASEWSGVARHWENIWGGLEVYNEPDLAVASADQYVPMVKALSYALKEADSKVPLVGGVFATMPPGPYFTTCAENGMLDDSDVVSFHSYDSTPNMEKMIGLYREWLKISGKENMPLWLTEYGKPWVNGPARPPQDQDAVSAMEISGMGVESMACGVARAFPFVLTYYEEGLKNFSMFGREASPLRSMAVYANTVSNLGGKKYLGDLKGVGESLQRARVFGDPSGGERVVVLYTGVIDSKALVSLPVTGKRIAGADGRELQPVNGKIPLPDGIGFLWANEAEIREKLDPDTEAARLYKIGQNPLVHERRASPVVLQLLPQNTPSRASTRRYLVTQETAKALPITVRIHNLSKDPLDVIPELTLPGGTPLKKESVAVPAMGFVDVDWKLDASNTLDIAKTKFIIVTAKSSAGSQPSPLAVPFVMEGNLEQHLSIHRNKSPLPIADLANWRTNQSKGKTSFSMLPDGVLRITSIFESNPGNRGLWTFPRFTLPKPIDPSTAYGILIRAKASGGRAPAIIAKTGVNGANEGIPFWVPDIFPGDGEWHVAYIPFAEFKPGPAAIGNQNTRLDPTTWRVLEFGGRSLALEHTLEISHLILVGGSTAD
ncbi:hypothetical protein TSACC_2580 [Terrimicrobium sacchariphilum]|uniref:Glycosyl hydrolase catalytic core n=1 Tax=Terrimicrobium sacchariphilum TaxID=690879 RepID=A0A146G409_TERSA|nr:hypothetical protein [Terrimicrobium sacchariphilum]GAT32182.1 hypothetical protein TSACC_2580 [Terrimicrobium sacchariphilum]